MTTVRDNLIAAKALIDTPEKWGKGNFFNGRCYCVAGALREATGAWDETLEFESLRQAMPLNLKGYGPVYFNDRPDTTHTDIMALFDRAIAAQPVSP